MLSKILVIDDCDAIREIIAEILRLENFQVLEAADANIGLTLAQSEIPDLIICDLMMPTLNGYEVIAQLRQYSSTQNLPFLLVTAQSELNNVGLAMALKREDYLTKPFTRNQLLRAVNDKLGNHSVKKAPSK